jgi:hypothetical protein
VNKQMQERHALLIEEFNQYLFDHPEFLEQIPQGAVIVLQLKGDEEYNRWSRRIARKTREKGQPLAFIEIRKLAPARSRLVEPQLRLEAVS